ncbi:cilia- and flagella-associated protein 77 [Scomber japonicus]|uniref:cilia- and flagella-associated protein 77 n=1 Tax=Scomber japonicus TaxID=13676 RepID=UPI00230688E6|nr:cilia- and flagella-associated protein 77 [Scomber japonicus]
MSSPRVGVVRDSMLTNPLLIKAPLGQIRSRGQTVPGPDFIFGSSSCSMGDGGVSEVLSSWRVQQQGGGRGHSAPDRLLVPDFLSLNRDAVKSGLVTSKELSQYRAQRGGARLGHAPKPPGGGSSRRPAVPDITFGVPPSLDTFRNEAARVRAFEAHQCESVSRRGAAGLGVYSLN